MTDLSTSELVSAPPEVRGSGPGWYLREAVRISRFDTRAIGRSSHDRAALAYGAAIFGVGSLLATAGVWPSPDVDQLDQPISPVAVVLMIGGSFAASALGIAVMHGAASLLFGATGTYLRLLRALWMGSLVKWLVVVPVVGPLVAGVWSLLVALVTFEEVDGIERLQALALSLGYNAAIAAISLAMS
jgi:hypothetical protein